MSIADNCLVAIRRRAHCSRDRGTMCDVFGHRSTAVWHLAWTTVCASFAEDDAQHTLLIT